MEKGPMYKVTFLKTYQTTKGRESLVGKNQTTPIALVLTCFGINYLLTLKQQYLTLNTFFLPYFQLQGRYETDHQAKDGPLIETREITPINDTYQTVLNKKEY